MLCIMLQKGINFQSSREDGLHDHTGDWMGKAGWAALDFP